MEGYFLKTVVSGIVIYEAVNAESFSKWESSLFLVHRAGQGILRLKPYPARADEYEAKKLPLTRLKEKNLLYFKKYPCFHFKIRMIEYKHKIRV